MAVRKYGWLLLMLMVGAAHAAVPPAFTYQGSIKQNGTPLNNVCSIELRITNVDGTQVYWTSGPQSVQVKDGLYRMEISPMGVDWASKDPYIETRVSGTLLLPREKMTSTPYALMARDLGAGASAKGDMQVAGKLSTADSLGVGTSEPSTKFQLVDSSAPNNQDLARVTAQTFDLSLGFRSGNPSIQARTPGNGVNRLSLNPDGGYVGVGTASPGFALSVKPPTNIPGINPAGDTYNLFGAGVDLNGASAPRQLMIQQWVSPSTKRTFLVGNGYIDGTSVPHSYDTSVAKFQAIQFRDEYFGFVYNDAGDVAPAVTIRPLNGDVGIHTFTPTDTLDVNGGIVVHGKIRNEDLLPAFFVNVHSDDQGGTHPYLGCPTGYAEAGVWWIGPNNGMTKGMGYTNGNINSGWMCMCVAN